VKLLEIQASPRGESSDSIAFTKSGLAHPYIVNLGTMGSAFTGGQSGRAASVPTFGKPCKRGQRPSDANIKRKVPPFHRSSLCDDLVRSG
jgi:hypothetical protein